MSFSGKSVWITGASSGIGAALVRAFDARGARCVLSARREDKLREVQQSCAHPDRHTILPFDMKDLSAHADLIDAAERACGPLDIVILNAGVSQRGLAVDTDMDHVRHIMDVNFTGAVSLARLAARMAERQAGHLVAISSVLGYVSIAGSSAYSAAKHAVRAYFNSLRAELHDAGVAVTVFVPGFVNTAISENALTGDGTAHGVNDQNHIHAMSADTCASIMLKGIEKRKAEVLIGGREKYAVPLTRHFPALARAVTRRFSRK